MHAQHEPNYAPLRWIPHRFGKGWWSKWRFTWRDNLRGRRYWTTWT